MKIDDMVIYLNLHRRRRLRQSLGRHEPSLGPALVFVFTIAERVTKRSEDIGPCCSFSHFILTYCL